LEFYQNANLRDELSKKALLQAAKYSWRRFTDEHIKIYQQLS
jgi:glycosyltransferase involved in cell wall biosynthesis